MDWLYSKTLVKTLVEKKEHGKLGQRLNKEKNGFTTILKKLFRQIQRNKIDENGSFKEQITSLHKRFNNVEYWRAIKRTAPPGPLKPNNKCEVCD